MHILKSIRHSGYKAEIKPARCRKCGFIFDNGKFRKPSRCPSCLSTWIAEPVITIIEKPEAQVPKSTKQRQLKALDEGRYVCEGVELLEHTADTGLIVRAATLPELFSRAAFGMFVVLADFDKVVPVESERIEVTADDLLCLFVGWLSELNFRHVTQRKLYCQFDLREVSETRAVADVWGEKIDPQRHTVCAEIKAVTRHNLKVKKVRSGWLAQVVFDL